MSDKPSQAPQPADAAEREVPPETPAETAPGAEQDQPVDASDNADGGTDGESEATPVVASVGLPPMQPMQSPPVPMAPIAQQPRPTGWAYPPPQPMPPMFDGYWLSPNVSGAPVALLAALIGGVAAAVFLPLDSPGIGWPLLGLATAAGLFLVGRKAERKVHIGRLLWAGAALLLLAVCAFRAAEWLSALCVMTAAVAGMLAVSGGRSVRAFAMAAVAIPVAAFRAVPWTVRGVRGLGPGKGGLRLVLSLAVALLLLVIFGALFAGADDNFADLVWAVLPSLDAETLFRWTFLLAFFGFAALGAAFTLLRPPVRTEPTVEVKTLRRLEWALPIGLLVALFAAFIAVQSTPMFGGGEHVQNTERLTYAGYARSGFWQLMVVTILTLPIIGGAARWAPKRTRFDRNLLRGLAGMLAVLTLLIVVSALIRMWAYQDAYGYTVMRLLVMSCELWLGVVYLLVIAAGVRLRASWLPAAVVGTAMAALLALAAINPEGLIAERNVARFQATGKLDDWYLMGLSTDVLPALRNLPDPQRAEITADIIEDLDDDTTWRSWNLSRHLAG
ncbi:DUF4173 domain-containing protein [Saccharopolyspora sp. K220]|uniref:DUF4153 domain-containing protein n=1 Tax=Saccharopolyspora soli TaxID=2926618 RepID=UPI001F56B0BB|nr:DUF4173 domain-containing protein [Saccharopolyspora soli]MCI2421769.1 DUF4173 domain-containing protein [Saccharopolyspora soli]